MRVESTHRITGNRATSTPAGLSSLAGSRGPTFFRVRLRAFYSFTDHTLSNLSNIGGLQLESINGPPEEAPPSRTALDALDRLAFTKVSTYMITCLKPSKSTFSYGVDYTVNGRTAWLRMKSMDAGVDSRTALESSCNCFQKNL
jgi:hypothetical protein